MDLQSACSRALNHGIDGLDKGLNRGIRTLIERLNHVIDDRLNHGTRTLFEELNHGIIKGLDGELSHGLTELKGVAGRPIGRASDQQWSGAANEDERGGDQARAQGRQGRGRHARLSIARVLVSLLVTIEDELIDDFSFSTCVSTFFQE
jgi:hypothetical protein